VRGNVEFAKAESQTAKDEFRRLSVGLGLELDFHFAAVEAYVQIVAE